MRLRSFRLAVLGGILLACCFSIGRTQSPASPPIDRLALHPSETSELILRARQQKPVSAEMKALLSRQLLLTAGGMNNYQQNINEVYTSPAEMEAQMLAEVTALIELGADVNIRGKALFDEYETPLYWAVANGRHSIVKALLKAGANPSTQYAKDYGDSPPDRTVAFATLNSLPILKSLIEAGANPSIRDGDKRTLLMMNARFGLTEACAYLLGLGVDPNAHDKRGSTALFDAAESGNSATVDLLLKHGANPQTTIFFSSFGERQTVLDVAARQCDMKSLRLLVARLPRGFVKKYVNQALFSALRIWVIGGFTYKKYRWHTAETIEFLIKQGANPNATDSDGNTALMVCVRNMYASGSNTVDLCLPPLTVLKLHGAQVNRANKQGQTALTSAVRIGRSTPVEWLLEHGANSNQRDKQGKNALIHLTDRVGKTQNTREDDEQIIKLLRRYKADPNLKDKTGSSAVDIARRNKQDKLLEALLRKELPQRF
jgi:uncharacterized protein